MRSLDFEQEEGESQRTVGRLCSWRSSERLPCQAQIERDKLDPQPTFFLMAVACETLESAVIMVTSADPGLPNRKVTGTVHARASKTLTLLTDEEIAASAMVRVQTKHFLSLGAVVSCVREPDAKCRVFIAVDRSVMII